MNRHTDPPGCWTTVPAPRPPAPRSCSHAETPQRWAQALDYTPGCAGCARATLGIRRWTSQQRRAWRLTEC